MLQSLANDNARYKLVRELQHADNISKVPIPFAVARHSLSAQSEPSTSEFDGDVEVFEHVSDTELRNLYEERERDRK